MQSCLSGNKTVEEEALSSFEYLKSFYAYTRTAFRFTHKPDQVENIKIIFFSSIEEKCEYLYYLFIFAMAKGTITSECLRCISSLIHYLSIIVGERINLITSKLGLKEDKAKALLDILVSVEEENSDEDVFISNMKVWFQQNERDSSIPEQIDY